MQGNVGIEIVGIIGAIGILLAYGLNSQQMIRSDSRAFVLLNLTGALLLILYSVWKEAWANMFINVVWVSIAVVALIRIVRQNRQKR